MQNLSKNHLLILLVAILSPGFLNSQSLFGDLLLKGKTELMPIVGLSPNQIRGVSVNDQLNSLSKALRLKFNPKTKSFSLNSKPQILVRYIINKYKESEPEAYAEAVRAFLAAAGYVALKMPVDFEVLLSDEISKPIKRGLLQNYCGYSPKDWAAISEEIEDYILKVVCVFFMFLSAVSPESYDSQTPPWSIPGKDSDDESVGPSRGSRGVSPASTPGTPCSIPGTTPPGLRLSDSAFGTPEKKK